MKIGVSSYSFSQIVGKEMTQLGVVAKAKEMGFDVLEFAALRLEPGRTPLSIAPRLREECDRVGIPVANYTIGADFLNGSGGDWKAEVERLKNECGWRRSWAAPGMRHDATGGLRGAPWRTRF